MSGDIAAVKEVSPGYGFPEASVLESSDIKQNQSAEMSANRNTWNLGDLSDFVTSGSRGWAAYYAEYGSLFIRSQNIKAGRLDFQDSQHVIPPSGAEGNRTLVRRGDILITITGNSVGNVAFVDREIGEAYISQHVGLIRLKDPSKADYICRFLSPGSKGNHQIVAKQSGQSKPGLTLQDLKDLVVDIPVDQEEQRAIATALSDVDALLEELDRLIAKKRDLKQATMQQLLTGQTRLPGFEGEWLQVRFGEVALPSSTRIDPSRSAQSEFCVELEHIEQRTGRLVGFTSTSQQSSLKAVFESGDVLFGKLRAYLRKYWLADREGTCSTEVWVLRPNPEKAISGYLYQLVRTDWFIEAASTAYGTHMPRSDWKVVRELELSIPELAEQEAISQTLGDMDAEVEALEQRRTKITALKQAMMQELLTGRTRLVEDNSQDKPDRDDKADRPAANVYFMRSVLAAEIVDQLHQEPTFGHVKFQKMLFLVEHLCDVDTGTNYHRQAAGPYDNRALRSIDSQLRKQQWFDARKESGRYHYVSMDKTGGHKSYFERYYAGIKARFSEVIETFRNLDTERCEIVATLFSAWDDLLKEKEAVSDAMIVHEVLNHWHESKRRIPEDRWLSALSWMREKGFVPKGSL